MKTSEPTPAPSANQKEFTWLPKAKEARIVLAIFLGSIYFDKTTQNAGFTTLGGFFLIALLRYGWFLLNQSPMPDLRRDWWRNPGSVSVGACVLIYAFVHSGAEQTGNPERGRTSESSSSYSSSNTSSSSDEDARLLRNIERAMREGPTSRNDRPAYQFPNVGSCSSCGRRGTITTASGYTIACPDCSGRGYRTDGGGTPKTFPKYGQ